MFQKCAKKRSVQVKNLIVKQKKRQKKQQQLYTYLVFT